MITSQFNLSIVIVDNTRNSGSSSTTFMKPNANYSMAGTEKYVNSGWFLPNGLEKEYPGSVTHSL